MGESGGRTPVEKIPVQNILRKNKKSWKVRQKSKNVDICFFAYILSTGVKDLTLQDKLDTRFCPHAVLGFF